MGSEDTEGQGTVEIEATGDALVIADAIERGLDGIARAIWGVVKVMNGEEDENDGGVEYYLDGTKK